MVQAPVPQGDTTKLRDSIISSGIPAALSTHLLEHIPFIFDDNWSLYRSWKNKLGNMIDIDPCNICVTGSAGIGFSLNPAKKFRSYSNDSDVDISIISEYHFSTAWRALRAVRLADAQNARERQSIIDHKEKYIYFGCIAADRVLRFLPFVRPWTEAMSAMSAEPPTEERVINFRIYKDYESLRAYNAVNLEALKADILAEQ